MSRRKPRLATARPGVAPEQPPPSGLLGDAQPAAASLGETFRRGALGLAAMLIVSRAYWPAEYRTESDSGSALFWSLLMLVAGTIGLMGMWLEGGLRLRRSLADLGVMALFALVALSAAHAADRRIAINFAWEWVGVGMAYLLLRHLPRTRSESSALAGAMVATAIAVSTYGLYQVAVEIPEARALYRANPALALQRAGMGQDFSEAQIKHLEDRLLGSREPIATFALANTLAGVLVGPAVIVLCGTLRALRRRKPSDATDPDEETADSRAGVFLLALPPTLVLIVCLLLTKSRSAYLGLLVAMLLFAWKERRRVSSRAIALGGLGLLAILGLLAAVLTMAGQLDLKVLTESTKSLSYRMEYWRGAWAVIWDGTNRWWSGLGPGNFAGPYLKHKLPTASEEIADPHNLILDVWATAGLPAVVAMLFALAFGLWSIFGPARLAPTEDAPDQDEAPPPRSATWLMMSAGLGGAVMVIALGHINPFSTDSMARWVILFVSWFLAASFGRPLWTRVPIAADLFGLAVIAIAVNLLAAGGIGFAPVSLMLWGLMALGLNLREDRLSGRRVPIAGRGLSYVVGSILAAILGTFMGTVPPFWRAESDMKAATAALTGLRADVQRADALYRRAAEADRFGSRAWVARANLEMQEWRGRGRPPSDLVWHRVDRELQLARTRPRDPNSLPVQRLRAQWAREFLDVLAQQFTELPQVLAPERYRLRSDLRDASARACRLYPTDASLRADFAHALAEIEEFPQAVEQARLALRLSDEMPHADRKLPPKVYDELKRQIPKWEVARPTPPPKPKPGEPTIPMPSIRISR